MNILILCMLSGRNNFADTILDGLFIIGALIFLIPSHSKASAGMNKRAFTSITLSAHYVLNSNRNMYHNYWKPANGFELQAESPFYLGNIELGIQISHITARRIEQPDFWSAYIFAGWGIDQKLFSGLHCYVGFRIGNNYMNFDDNAVYPTLKSENELGLGLKTDLRLILNENLYLILSGRYRVIYTHHRIYHSFISIGFGKSFSTPRWLKEILD